LGFKLGFSFPEEAVHEGWRSLENRLVPSFA
jgi:hypothetical protein